MNTATVRTFLAPIATVRGPWWMPWSLSCAPYVPCAQRSAGADSVGSSLVRAEASRWTGRRA